MVYACDAVGIQTSTYYQWKRDDPIFAAQVKDAQDRVVEQLEQVAHERARKGLSDSLTMFLLKHLKPQVFNSATQTVTASVSLTASLTPDAIKNLTNEELKWARHVVRRLRGEHEHGTSRPTGNVEVEVQPIRQREESEPVRDRPE